MVAPRSSSPLGLVFLLLVACATAPGVSTPPAPVHAARPSCVGARACLAACDLGDVRACTLAADRLRYGSGTARDVPHAERLYRRACEAGDGLGCAGWGWVSQAPASEDAFRRARPLLESACALEEAEACVSVGLLRLEGRGGAVEATEGEARLRRGLELLSSRCESGEGAACVRAATLFEAGPAPVLEDSRALVSLQRACDAGVPGGCSALALRHLTGRGVPPDRARALALYQRVGELYRASCEAGESVACAELGQAFALGQAGGAADPARALVYQEKACALGEVDSCLVAAERLRQGAEGVTPDGARASSLEARAEVLLEEACRSGSGVACLSLAERVTPERARALRQRACELGQSRVCEGAR
jgi:TPR repeat protein